MGECGTPADTFDGVARYDRIGIGYSSHRRPEPAWEQMIWSALGGCRTVLNVGAGTGNYEPADRAVTAVEPSTEMIRQRAVGAAPAVRASAEALPFRDGMFDAALALLTVHHWPDQHRGLTELKRVSSRQVVMLFEPLDAHAFWLLDYFPEAMMGETERSAPGVDDVAEVLDVVSVEKLLVPADCRDGVAAAYWARPEKYLDASVQNAMSLLAMLDPEVRQRGTQRLASDLADGTWERTHGANLDRSTPIDAGYRLVVAGATT